MSTAGIVEQSKFYLIQFEDGTFVGKGKYSSLKEEIEIVHDESKAFRFKSLKSAKSLITYHRNGDKRWRERIESSWKLPRNQHKTLEEMQEHITKKNVVISTPLEYAKGLKVVEYLTVTEISRLSVIEV